MRTATKAPTASVAGTSVSTTTQPHLPPLDGGRTGTEQHASLSTASRRVLLAEVSQALRQEPARAFRYLVNNEGNAFRALHGITKLGGGYLGIGTEINFTYAAAARSSFMILCDVTPEVGRLHELYRALHLIAPRREEFLRYAFFAPSDAKLDTTSTSGLVDSAYRAGIGKHGSGHSVSYDEDILDRVARPVASAGHMTLEAAREAARTLIEIAPTLRASLVRTDDELRQRAWIASDATYAHIRDLFVDERVLIVTRDITAMDDAARQQLRRAHDAMSNEPLRVVYLSNVPDYIQGEPHDRLCASLRAYEHLDWKRGALVKALDGGRDRGQSLYHLSSFTGAHFMHMSTTVHPLDAYVESPATRSPFSEACERLPENRAMQRHESTPPLSRVLLAGAQQARYHATQTDLTPLLPLAAQALEPTLRRRDPLSPEMESLVQGVLAALVPAAS